MHKSPTVYASGANTERIINGISASKYEIGTSAQYLARPSAFRATVWHLLRDGRVFVDSGAFSAFTSGKPLQSWAPIFAAYHKLIEAAPSKAGQIVVVAPDLIGDQEATLQEWKAQAEELRALSLRGVSIIFPLQRGALSLAELWAQAPDLPRKVAGIPSNVKAVPAEEAIAFVAEAQPAAIHILGMSEANSKAAKLLLALGDASPLTLISMDANRVAAKTGKGRPITEAWRSGEARHQFLTGQFRDIHFEAELLDALREVSPEALQESAAGYGLDAVEDFDTFAEFAVLTGEAERLVRSLDPSFATWTDASIASQAIAHGLTF